MLSRSSIDEISDKISRFYLHAKCIQSQLKIQIKVFARAVKSSGKRNMDHVDVKHVTNSKAFFPVQKLWMSKNTFFIISIKKT